MSTKTIRLSDEVLKMLNLCKAYEKQSMSQVILQLLYSYETDRESEEDDHKFYNQVSNYERTFILTTKYGEWVIPKYTKFDNIIRVNDGAYSGLTYYKMHIDESFNTTVFRMAANYIMKNNIPLPADIKWDTVVYFYNKDKERVECRIISYDEYKRSANKL